MKIQDTYRCSRILNSSNLQKAVGDAVVVNETFITIILFAGIYL